MKDGRRGGREGGREEYLVTECAVENGRFHQQKKELVTVSVTRA